MEWPDNPYDYGDHRMWVDDAIAMAHEPMTFAAIPARRPTRDQAKIAATTEAPTAGARQLGLGQSTVYREIATRGSCIRAV